jgi:hypothetical protein
VKRREKHDKTIVGKIEFIRELEEMKEAPNKT